MVKNNIKKTSEKRKKVTRQNRRSDGDQETGIPKTPKERKVKMTLQN